MPGRVYGTYELPIVRDVLTLVAPIDRFSTYVPTTVDPAIPREMIGGYGVKSLDGRVRMSRGLVLDPRVEIIDQINGVPAVPGFGFGSLRGKTVGFRVDYHWHSWDWVSDEWADQFRKLGAKVVVWRATHRVGKNAEDADRELREFVADLDLAVIGLANCGGCTMQTVTDAVTAARGGKPTVAVATEQFASLAEQLAARKGLPGLRIQTLPFPLETRPETEVRAIAREHFAALELTLADAI